MEKTNATQENSLAQSGKQVKITPRVLDPESGYDDEEEGRKAEEAALKHSITVNQFITPTRNYFQGPFMELLLKALHDLDTVRPNDPLEFFAYYLLKHNPYYKPNQQ